MRWIEPARQRALLLGQWLVYTTCSLGLRAAVKLQLGPSHRSHGRRVPSECCLEGRLSARTSSRGLHQDKSEPDATSRWTTTRGANWRSLLDEPNRPVACAASVAPSARFRSNTTSR